MEQQQGSAAPMRGAVSERTVGAVTAIAFFLVGVVMIVDNYKIGAGWAQEGSEAGYFPLRIGVIICVAASVVLFRTVFAKGSGDRVFVTFSPVRARRRSLRPSSMRRSSGRRWRCCPVWTAPLHD